MNGRRIFDAFRQARQPQAHEWMALADAAQALRAAQQGSDLDRISRGLSQSDDSLLMFWARQVAQIGVAVYGRRIMAEKLEAIPAEIVLTGRIIDGATRLETGQGGPIQDFGALQVKRAAFEAALAGSGTESSPQA